MTFSPEQLLAESSAVACSAASLPADPADYARITDLDLKRLTQSAAELSRAAARHIAMIAGEVARRSSRELGHSGFAQRQGFRTPEEFVRVATGTTARDASTAVRVGRLVQDAASGDVTQPWLAAVATGLASGELSVAAADAIRTGVGLPSADIGVAVLAAAVERLVGEAGSIDADQVLRRARDLRNEIDEAGVVDRERALREKRSLWFKKLPDGTARLNWTLDPESAAVCGDLFDRATSPRRGGPRFVSGDNEELAARIVADPRTTEQLVSDTFLELLRQGAAADSSQLLGTGAPVVKVLVAERSLRSGDGVGYIEAQSAPVSIATVERSACSGGVVDVVFNESLQPIDVGRDQRLFTKRQKFALAARDGGCMWADCNCPPSWTEAHHIEGWASAEGQTDVANGILLCRFHHLLLHDQGWVIVHEGLDFWLIPPHDVDPRRTRIAMPTKSPAMRDAFRERYRRTG